MTKPPKRPRDFSQAAKFVVDVATGQAPNDAPPSPKGPSPQSLGGKKRAVTLVPRNRRGHEIAC